MTGEQAALTGIASATEHAAELRSRGDDPTPRGVVRAALAAALPRVVALMFRDSDEARFILHGHDGASFVSGDRPLRVLDVCAGYGCWASEMPARPEWTP